MGDPPCIRMAGVQIRENYNRQSIINVSRNAAAESLPRASVF